MTVENIMKVGLGGFLSDQEAIVSLPHHKLLLASGRIPLSCWD